MTFVVQVETNVPTVLMVSISSRYRHKPVVPRHLHSPRGDKHHYRFRVWLNTRPTSLAYQKLCTVNKHYFQENGIAGSPNVIWNSIHQTACKCKLFKVIYKLVCICKTKSGYNRYLAVVFYCCYNRSHAEALTSIRIALVRWPVSCILITVVCVTIACYCQTGVWPPRV